jgi:hypothetical protein
MKIINGDAITLIMKSTIVQINKLAYFHFLMALLKDLPSLPSLSPVSLSSPFLFLLIFLSLLSI